MNFDDEVNRKFTLARQYINKNYNMANLLRPYCDFIDSRPRQIKSVLNPDDSAPSMFIDWDKRVWHCFSKKKGGGYLELLYRINTYRNNDNTNIVLLANKILRNDEDMQHSLGFKSIIKHENKGELNLKVREYQVRKINTLTLDKLVKNLYKEGKISILLNLMTDYQMGDDVQSIISRYAEELGKTIDISMSDKEKLKSVLENLIKEDKNG